MRGGDKAIHITESNPNLKMDFIDAAIIEIAANGRKVDIPKKVIRPRHKRTKVELEEEEEEIEEGEGGENGKREKKEKGN